MTAVFYPNHQIDCIHGRALGQVAVQKERYQTLLHIDEVTGIDIKEMVMTAGVGVVIGFRSADEDLSHQTLLGKQSEGIVNRCPGNLGSTFLNKIIELLSSQMLIAGKQDLGNDLSLRGGEYAMLRQQVVYRLPIFGFVVII